MPELPEVETTKRILEPFLVKKKIIKIIHNDPPRYENTEKAIGQKILAITRRGKHLIFNLEDLDIAVHLKMTGGFRLPSDRFFAEAPRFERLRLKVEDYEVSFVDSRRFGYWKVIEKSQTKQLLAELGPEPLSDEFELDTFAQQMAKIRSLKPALLNQKIVAGLGNIYVDEALWQAQLHPEQGFLDFQQSERLFSTIREVLARAIEAGGSTLSDNSYQQPDNKPGYFQFEHNAYAQKLCKRCGSAMKKYALAGRGTHFCPHCQRL